MQAKMTPDKTSRAFRTISEAGEELGLQPHVLRFWESKFTQIKPLKRGGGRRFYRPDDIEFLRGIKTLLHDEKHPIKDVQKLIQKKGAARITELGRSVEKASRERAISETDLLPERIKSAEPAEDATRFKPEVVKPRAPIPAPIAAPPPAQAAPRPEPAVAQPSLEDRQAMLDAVERLKALRAEWANFRQKAGE